MSQLKFHRVKLAEAPSLTAFADHTIHQSKEWLQFVSATQKAEPVIAVVKDGERTVGRFTGLIVRKLGLRILGSPFQGWTTSYMGFNLDRSVPRGEAVLALRDFAFRQLGCVHLEVMDRNLSIEDAERLGFRYQVHGGFEIDLTRSEKELLASMADMARRNIRKAEREGVTLEEATDQGFADDYYSQLEDVFAKQQLVPTYPKSRVQALMDHLLPTGRLLLVRARSKEGKCIATGIFPGMNDTMYFWGGASYRPDQHLRPNEAIQWFAMRWWKTRGISKYDLGGGSEYKRKYGGRDIAIPWIRASRYPILEHLRTGAKKLFAYRQRLLGKNKA